MLPLGEALNVVRRRSDGELVIRSDAGHDFCRFDRNWKMHAPMFVRDTDELLREVYPRMAHCDPEWMELREFYCPLSGRCWRSRRSPRGYPVVHDFLPDIEGFYGAGSGASSRPEAHPKPGGTVACPKLSEPQQIVSAFVPTAQLWLRLTPRALNAPAGGVAWPAPLSPQQASVVFVLIPQE